MNLEQVLDHAPKIISTTFSAALLCIPLTARQYLERHGSRWVPQLDWVTSLLLDDDGMDGI